VSQRQIGCLQGERLVDRGDGRTTERGDGLHGALLADVPADDFVDFVDLDGADQQRLTPLDVGGEAIGLRAAGEVFDPAARIDQDQ
jgi:hypothetical protein